MYTHRHVQFLLCTTPVSYSLVFIVLVQMSVFARNTIGAELAETGVQIFPQNFLRASSAHSPLKCVSLEEKEMPLLLRFELKVIASNNYLSFH